jgi:hypothetical protein
VQAYLGRVGEFEQWNSPDRDADQVEAVHSQPRKTMTSRRFPPPWQVERHRSGRNTLSGFLTGANSAKDIAVKACAAAANLVECDCGWRPELGAHYRVAGGLLAAEC